MDPDISTGRWIPVRKKPIVVHVRPATEGDEEMIWQRERSVLEARGFSSGERAYPHYYVMRGVEGEEYPIHREILQKTYDLAEEPTSAESK